MMKHNKFYLLLVWGILMTCTSVLKAQNVTGLLGKLSKTNNVTEKTALYYQIGELYHRKGIYKKAIEYYSKNAQQTSNDAQKIRALRNMAICHMTLKKYDNASGNYQTILEVYKKNNDLPGELVTLKKLSTISKLSNNYSKALEYNQHTLAINQQLNNNYGQANSLNNIGFLYQKLDQYPNALKSFNQALALMRNDNSARGLEVKAKTLLNAGVSHNHLKDYKNAQISYNNALQIRTQQGDPIEIARVYNYLAINDYIHSKNTQAMHQAQKAIDLGEANAKKPKANEVLQVSYRLLAEVYQKENDFKSYKKYYAKHLALKEKIAENSRAKQQKIIESHIEADKKENDFKMLIAEKEKQALSLKQLKLEADKKEQDLALKAKELKLLKQSQDLQNAEFKNQQLEKDRVVQLLALAEQKASTAKQKALTEKQKQEATRQKLLADKQKLLVAKQKAENLQKAKALEMAQKEKALQKEQLKQEKNLRWYGTIVLILVATLFIFALVSFFASQRARKKLKQQNLEIQKQNLEIQKQKEELASQHEELFQSQEEVMSQRDFIEKKNVELGLTNKKLLHGEKVLKKAYAKLQESEEDVKTKNKELNRINSRIKNSITVAQNIQNAILPRPQKMKRILNNHFTIYHPKDVVSGDFYWMEEVDDKVFLIAADCTGHGVPGALMSMVGNALIDKVILIKKIFDPSQILEELHKEIRIALNQEESGDDNGMDIAVVCLDKAKEGKVKVKFCGAKNPLYYIENGSTQLKELKGTRRSIGGRQPDFIPFANQEIILEEGSTIYMGSDGFVDQNNEKRVSFGTKKLRKLLETCATLDVNKQKVLMEQALENQMANTTQRDDILFMGVKV